MIYLNIDNFLNNEMNEQAVSQKNIINQLFV